MRNPLLFVAAALTAVGAFANSHVSPHDAAPPPVTFSHQIAPILYKNCSTCHHPGGEGPFSLLSYADARRWAPQIVRVTQNHFMPPWLPEPGYGDFADQERLSAKDIELIRRWASSGTPEGNPSEAPPAPHYSTTWQLGTPDLVLSVKNPTHVPASGKDVWINFVLPYPLQQTHYIRAMQILPGTPQVIHHANIEIDRTASLRHANPKTWQQGLPGMELVVYSGNAFDPDSHFLLWKSDTPVLVEPKNMPWRLDPGNDLILNMHLKPTGKPEVAEAKVGLYFTDRPPTAHPILLELEDDSALDIPPGDPNYVIQDQLKLPVDVQVLAVYPHSHYTGKDLQGYAVLPNGQKKWLIWIRNWDVDRQAVYNYRRPIFLPKGTVLHIHYTFDNSANNIHNPNNPPLRLRAGNRSVDERGQLWVQVLPMEKTVESAGKLEDSRVALERAWMESRLRKNASDPIGLYNMAAIELAEGNYDRSIAYAEVMLKHHQDPVYERRALIALGVAQQGKGDWKQAEQSYQQALTIDPTSTDARFDLARLDLKRQAFPEAATQFRVLLANNSQDEAAHSGLGVALFDQDDIAGAQDEFQKALTFDPQDFTALSTLGQIYITSGNLPKAIETLQSALEVQNDPDARQLLAMAYAQSGNLSGAADQLEQALRVRPTSAITYGLLSRVYSSMGRYNDALAARKKALHLQPNDADGWNDLGVLEIHLSDVALARNDFQHALQIDPNHALARANLERTENQSQVH
jgi:tetratricopeptide (TPR) repeat protein